MMWLLGLLLRGRQILGRLWGWHLRLLLLLLLRWWRTERLRCTIGGWWWCWSWSRSGLILRLGWRRCLLRLWWRRWRRQRVLLVFLALFVMLVVMMLVLVVLRNGSFGDLLQLTVGVLLLEVMVVMMVMVFNDVRLIIVAVDTVGQQMRDVRLDGQCRPQDGQSEDEEFLRRMICVFSVCRNSCVALYSAN